MSESELVRDTSSGLPLTIREAAKQLSALGVSPDMVLMAHASLSKLGWVCGGPVTSIKDSSLRTDIPFAYRDLDECMALIGDYVQAASRFRDIPNTVRHKICAVEAR